MKIIVLSGTLYSSSGTAHAFITNARLKANYHPHVIHINILHIYYDS